MTESVHAFPKIFTVGQSYIRDLLDGPVEVTEKVDGSQFAFGKRQGALVCRSKGQVIYAGSANKMFQLACDRAQLIWESGCMPEGWTFWCEYLQKPKHNVLTYGRVPTGNLVMFAAEDENGQFMNAQGRRIMAVNFGIDAVPVLYEGADCWLEDLERLIERESYLGLVKVEGVVVKNYRKPFLLGGQPIPVMSGKLVRADFKEVHREGWQKENTSRGTWETDIEGYRTEARWLKAAQKLREAGTLTDTLKDIGPLIREVQRDITEEERRDIEQLLWRRFGPDLLRRSTAGLPEWYKKICPEQVEAPMAVGAGV